MLDNQDYKLYLEQKKHFAVVLCEIVYEKVRNKYENIDYDEYMRGGSFHGKKRLR